MKDSLQALREVYGLSEAELQKLQQEVESEYAAEQASGQQRIQHRYGSWSSIKQLLFTAKGRLSRGDFWLAELGVFVVHSLIAASTGSYPVLGILVLICWLAHINLAIKRCHDRGYSGWFLLLGIVPLSFSSGRWWNSSFWREKTERTGLVRSLENKALQTTCV